MPTASLNFLAFAAVVALVSQAWNHRLWRGGIFLLANLAYLTTLGAQPAAFVPFALFLVGGFLAVKLSGRAKSGWVTGLLVVTIVLAFCWLKKYWFLSGLGFLGQTYVTIGLSYIFFRVLHLVIDAKDHEELAAIDGLSYANYTLNFTALVAGPIQRYEDFTKPLPPLDLVIAGRAIERIVIGMFKVLVVGGVLFQIHSKASNALLGASTDPLGDGLIALTAYPIYLYFNFSGYMDIVIGAARFIGLELPENFNRPFSALNFMDFWARYHMTLSNWLRDYVYTPFLRLLMSRFPKPGLDPLLGTLAFFVTFFLIGIWHGPTPMFALYGLFLAVGISANKLYQTLLIKRWGRKQYKALAAKPVYQAGCRGLTFTWYAISMVCFWAGADEAKRLLAVLGPERVAEVVVLQILAASLALSAIEAAREAALRLTWRGASVTLSRYTRTVWATVLVFLSVSAVLLTQNPAPDIVYKAV